jgi:glutathione S-transferase
MQPLQLIIGNKNYSSWSLRPWLALKHADLPFEEIMIHLYTGDSRPKILAYNPAGKVPALLHGDLLVWESLAICEYAAELAPSLWPEDLATRAWARSVATEMHGGFANLRGQCHMNCRATGRKVELSEGTLADIERIATVWRACRQAHANKGPWLFGRFSIADAMYAPVVTRFHTYGIALDDICHRYVCDVLEDSHMRAWFADSAAETEVIASSETGK